MTTNRPPTIRVALAGNPNSGKTTVFNALTGAHQRVGNYAGVTVERREGHYDVEGLRFSVADLPGTYSLSGYSPEERIAQQALLADGIDVVVVIVDSTTLKRSLVLLAQIMQLGANPVLCLNMADEAQRAGQQLDLSLLAELLGIPVVETVGCRATGIDELRGAVIRAANAPVTTSRLVLGDRLEHALATLNTRLVGADLEPAGSWVATKLLLDTAAFVERTRTHSPAGAQIVAEAQRLREQLERDSGVDIGLFVMERYYAFVDGLLQQVVLQRSREDARAISDGIDRVLVNRVLGLPFFLAAMYAIFWIAFTVGEIPMAWIESGFGALGQWIAALWPAGADSPLRSLLVDGVIGGVGGVIVFLPNIVLLFLCLALLEDTGYMARAAFLADRFLHRFGLHGRSFIPLMTGFGCSIPGIMATRTLENERDRLATIMVLPLMSCGARLPIWMLLIPAFYPPAWRAPMLWSIYTIGIALALVLVLVLRKSLLRGEEAPFVMELPPYRMPTARAVMVKMVDRSWLYLRKAGTVILAISIVMWAVTSYPKAEHYTVDDEVAAGKLTLSAGELEQRRRAEDQQASLGARIGRAIEPLIRPLGFDWKIGTALVGAFAAKEVFVAQMGIVHALGETDEQSSSLREVLARDYSPLVGFSLMLFLLIGTPCMATFAVTRRETGSWRWAALQFGGLTVLAYLVALSVFQLGRLFG